MPRYVALLRGVSPMNLRMPELARCLELAGFTAVRTLLSSGNVAFDAPRRSEAALARAVESAVEAGVGRHFWTTVRTSRHLQALVASDPYADASHVDGAKRIVAFMGAVPEPRPALPLQRDGARLLAIHGLEAFGDYVPGPRGAAFMTVLEKTLGKNITTRTWATVEKCAAA